MKDRVVLVIAAITVVLGWRGSAQAEWPPTTSFAVSQPFATSDPDSCDSPAWRTQASRNRWYNYAGPAGRHVPILSFRIGNTEPVADTLWSIHVHSICNQGGTISRMYLYREFPLVAGMSDLNSYFSADDILLDAADVGNAFEFGDSVLLSGHGDVIAGQDTAWYHLVVDMDSVTLADPFLNNSWVGVQILDRRIELGLDIGRLWGPVAPLPGCALTFPNAYSIIVDNTGPQCLSMTFGFREQACDDACDGGGDLDVISLGDSALIYLDLDVIDPATDTCRTGWPKIFVRPFRSGLGPFSMGRFKGFDGYDKFVYGAEFDSTNGPGPYDSLNIGPTVDSAIDVPGGFYYLVAETKDVVGNAARCSTLIVNPIDTRKPAVAARPRGFTLAYDANSNGVVNPGDSVRVFADMSNEPFGEICTVTATLYGWYAAPYTITLADAAGNQNYSAVHAVGTGTLITAGAQQVQIRVTDNACNLDSLPATLLAAVDILPPDVLWVDMAGNDATGDGTFALPFRTIQHAMTVVAPGKTIMVRPGTYEGPVEFVPTQTTHLLSEQGPFVTTIIGTSSGAAPAVTMAVGSLVDSAVLDGFTIRGNAPSALCAGCASGITVEYPTRATIVNNIVTNNTALTGSGGIRFYGTGGLIADNWIVDNVGGGSGTAGALLLRDDANVKIVNNTIVGNSDVAGSAAAGVRVIDIDSNGQTNQLFFDNNIVAFNSPGSGFVGMTLAVGGGAAARNNLYYSNADTNTYPPGIPQASWVFGDPLLRDRLKGDYHLTCASPARNVGRVLSVPVTGLPYDIDGDQSRTTGGKVDIGADQFYDEDKNAVFYPNDTTGCATVSAPFTVIFDNHSTCIPENWRWSFGDGDTSVAPSPIHAYSAAGNYTVRLIAWGEKDADTAYGIVHVVAPITANFSAPTTVGCKPLSVTFTASPNSASVRYMWEFGDGDVDSSGVVVTHQYDSADVWTVQLRVRSACGTTTVTKPDYITVKPPPTVTITSDWVDPPPGPVCNPHTVKFGYTSDQKITAFAWDFGDNQFSSDSTPTHIYADGDTFGVQLTATSECGVVSIVRRDYIKLVPRPTATASITPSFVCVAQGSVRCSAAVTGQYLSAQWYFGDGSSVDGLVGVHAYGGIGYYRPLFVFTHTCGTDTVRAIDSIAVGDRPAAAFSAAPDSGYEPFTVVFTDQSTNIPVGWQWEFGDGEMSDLRNPTYRYTPGVYDAFLVAENPCGADITGSHRIVVGGFAAVIVDSLGTAGDTILYSVRVDTLVIPYDHPVTVSGRLTTTPRRGTMRFMLLPPSGVPPFTAVMQAIPTRDLAAGDYTVEFVATDSSRTSDLHVPISKAATRGLHYLAQPLLRIDPFPLAMDSTPIGFPISKTVTITNTASTIQGYRVVVQAPTTSGPPLDIPIGSGTTLAPQQHLTWTVEFSPLQKRDFAGWIRLRSDDPASTDTLIPVTGRGIGEQTPPRVMQTQPAQGSESAIDEPVRFEFSEAMVSVPLDTILTARSKRADAAVPVHAQWVGTALNVSADDWFRPDDTITVNLRAMITDTNGNRLDGNGNGIEDGSPVDDYRLVFLTGPGVYPGDANRDGSVSEADLLPVARFYWLTGPIRQHQYPGFTPQPALSWTPREATNADADGNGQIDSADICPIAEFFGRDSGLAKTHVETWLAETTQWSNGVIEALLAALVDCPGEPTGRETLRRLLEDTRTTKGPRVPRDFALDQNYPNPFNPTTVIIYALPRRSEVHLEIFDILGRRVAVLAEGTQEAGRYQRLWDGRDDSGGFVGSGIYFYRLVTADFQQTRKMVLLK